MAMALCLSPWALEQIDKLRRTFIWCGEQTVSVGKCKVAWKTVCRPHDLGGLGVIDLRRASIALRARWEWKRRVDHGLDWGSLHRAKEKAVVAVFRAASVSDIGSGESTYFWTDNWLQGTSIQSMAPALFQAVSARRRKALVCDALPGNAWVRHINGAHTVQVINEYLMLWHRLQHVQLVPGTPDVFRWRLTADGTYSSASVYGAMFFGSSRPLGVKEIWKTSAPPKVRLFFWLVMHRKCWTAEQRFRHGLQDSPTCVICDQLLKTMDHIVLGCVFSREVWCLLLTKLHLQDIVLVQEEDVMA